MSDKTELDLALASIEKGADKIVQLCALPTGMMGLTAAGRMFFREIDNRNYNTTGMNTGPKYIWREVEGPPL